jgi:hypothetical protein
MSLQTNEDKARELLFTSYDPTVPSELEKAKEVLAVYGFVKFNLRAKCVYDSNAEKTVPLDFFLEKYYTHVQRVFKEIYHVDIVNEDEINEARKGKNSRYWPTSLNIGKIGAVHIIKKSACSNNNGITLDPINQTILSYFIKAYFCHEIFAELLGDSKLLASIEPSTMVFPVGPTNASNLCTRLVYNPGVLSKGSMKITTPSQAEPNELAAEDEEPQFDTKSDTIYDILKSQPYCGALAVTSGDSIGLVPSSHEAFPELLQYMRNIRHTDKRTKWVSTAPNEFGLEDYVIQVPLERGDLLVYDRRIPNKINPISSKFMETRTEQSIVPFLTLNVSFSPSKQLSGEEVAVRAITFMQRKVGSGLKMFGHVENAKRRGIPILVDENVLQNAGNWLYSIQSTSDPILRKVIGLENWT